MPTNKMLDTELILDPKCDLDLELKGIKLSRYTSCHMLTYSHQKFHGSSTFILWVMHCHHKLWVMYRHTDNSKSICLPPHPSVGGIQIILQWSHIICCVMLWKGWCTQNNINWFSPWKLSNKELQKKLLLLLFQFCLLTN